MHSPHSGERFPEDCAAHVHSRGPHFGGADHPVIKVDSHGVRHVKPDESEQARGSMVQ